MGGGWVNLTPQMATTYGYGDKAKIKEDMNDYIVDTTKSDMLPGHIFSRCVGFRCMHVIS